MFKAMKDKFAASRFGSSRLPDDVGDQARLRVLMVCLGNICRSPTAEAVLRHKLKAVGLDTWVQVDSAGTFAGHVGSPPDERAQKHAKRRGYDLSPLRARKVDPSDYAHFDLILAMDWDNLALLEERCPPEAVFRRKLKRLTDYLPTTSPLAGAQSVPDPYYGGPDGFEAVLDLVEASCDGLVAHLQARLDPIQPSTVRVDPEADSPAGH